MKLSIVIPVFNNWNFTKACLNDLSELKDTEIVLVDNGSEDETIQINKEELPSFTRPENLVVLRSEENLGFARSSNWGCEVSSGEYVLFLNNDIRVQKDKSTWPSVLITEAQDGSLVGPNGGILDEHLNFIRETDKLVPGNFYMSGWCLCAKREVFDKLVLSENEYAGPFIEEFTTYFEDTDLSFRARELGIPMKIVPVPVFHFGKMTSKKIGLLGLYQAAKVKFINKWGK